MKVGDLVLLTPKTTGASEGLIQPTGPALVLAIDSLSGLQVLTNEQKLIWVGGVGTNEVEVLNENR